jgi:hypothetical protein
MAAKLESALWRGLNVWARSELVEPQVEPASGLFRVANEEPA